MSITIPADYGYVLATALGSSFVAAWHGLYVGSARKLAQVSYPNSYAPDSEAQKDVNKYRFNCTQRAHAHYLENLPIFLTTLAISGLKHPKASSVAGVAWLVSRVVFAVGYRNSSVEQKGAGRLKGISYAIVQLGLLGSAAWSVWGIVMG